MTTKISSSNIRQTTLDNIGGGGGGGPKITGIEVTNSSYTVIDDTAVSLTGGYIKITGTGFTAGCRVLINNTPATSVTFVNSTTVRAQVGAKDAGTYVVYLANTDGGVAISVDGLTYSDTPTWVTGSTLASQRTDVPISIQLSAAQAQTFVINPGSTLPTGLSLSSGGLLSGTVSIAEATTYSFTINAIDSENQDSPRTFSLPVTVVVTDPYFSATSLLIPGVGTNNSNNSTFLDSSSNNFTITRNGDTAQGSFSPFSPTGWSNYFDGTGDFLSVPNNSALDLGSGDYTIEGWWYFTDTSNQAMVSKYTANNGYVVQYQANNLRMVLGLGSNDAVYSFAWTAVPNTWNHVAITRSGTSGRAFINGVQIGSTTTFTTSNTVGATTLQIGSTHTTSELTRGYVSNFRLVKGTAVYTSAFTPSTSPLTAVTNTTLLTCQSNRFKDSSTNNFTITRNGDVSVQPFSPFSPAVAYNATSVCGSGYFDGSADSLTIPWNAAFDFGTGDFTVEAWVYPNSGTSEFALLSGLEVGSSDLVYYANSFRFGRNNVAWDTTFNHTLTTNQWCHIAFVKASGNAKVFVNGQQIGDQPNGSGYGSVGGTTIVGTSRDSSRAISGYLSNYRIVKGTAVYTSDFTPPTAPVTAITNTSLLLNFKNHNITDATSRNIIVPLSSSRISTAQSKFEGSSILIDGNGLLVRTSNYPGYSSLLDFPKSGTVATIEMWVRLTSLNGPRSSLISHWSTNEAGWTIDLDTSGNLFYASNGSGISGAALGATTNTWHHIAIVNTGSQIKAYLDGVLKSSVSNYSPSNPNGYPHPIYIGYRTDGTLGTSGYISNVRITHGVARYTANFTVPTDPFPVQ